MAKIQATHTATKVLTVTNLDALIRGMDRQDIFRCDHCYALLLDSDAKAHLLWHSTILHVPK